MNLVNQNWIPVTDTNGEARRVSLRDVFAQGHGLRDLAVRPHERVALMRLLLCIAQAALRGPENSSGLSRALVDLPKAAEAYLNAWADCFDLFHATKPFLQFAGLTKPPKAKATKAKNSDSAGIEEEEATAASKLDFAMATGNNPTLFDNAAATNGERVFDAGQLGLMLVTFQCFSPGGRIGVAQWHDAETPGGGSSGHAPCSPSAMLHAFVRGKTVLETVALNLVPKDKVEQLYERPFGMPVWEQFPSSFDDKNAVENATKTFLGRLTPLTRAILLKPDGSGITLANGLDYPGYPKFVHEPTATLIKKQKDDGLALLGGGTGKAIWRELSSVTLKRRIGDTGGPLVLAAYNIHVDVDLWVGALVTDKASILDAVESVYRIPPRLFAEAGRLLYESEIRNSDHVAGKLADACKAYRQTLELKPQGYPEQQAARRRFWTEMEQHSYRLLDYLRCEDGTEESNKALSAWRKGIWRAAHTALDDSCPAETPRQRRAHALAKLALQKVNQSLYENQTQPTPSTP